MISNGVALCKLHHAAFDRFFFAIRPDYVIEVRPSVLIESDGPMLVVGLQQINGQQIHLPRRTIDLPDPARLAPLRAVPAGCGVGSGATPKSTAGHSIRISRAIFASSALGVERHAG